MRRFTVPILVIAGLAVVGPAGALHIPSVPAQVAYSAPWHGDWSGGQFAWAAAAEAAQALRDAEAVQEAARVAQEAADAQAALEAAQRAYRPPVVAPAAVPASGPTNWDGVAQCETAGNWAMTGSSYSGGLGFANTSWEAFGGLAYAPNAGQATREQQIIVAEAIKAYNHGSLYGAWGCAAYG